MPFKVKNPTEVKPSSISSRYDINPSDIYKSAKPGSDDGSDNFLPDPRSIFEVPLLGWDAEAKVVKDINPDLSAFMSGLSLFVRTVAEESCRDNFEELLQPVLLDMGLNKGAINKIKDGLNANHFPLSSKELANDLVDLQKPLMESGDLSTDDTSGHLYCALMVDSHYAHNGHTETPLKRYWGGKDITELPPTFFPGKYYKIDDAEVRGIVAVASIESPIIASGSNFGAVAIKPATSTGDDLHAQDHTYLGRSKEVYVSKDLIFNSPPAPVIPPHYEKPPVDNLIPDDWTEKVLPGLNIFVYSFSLLEENQFPYAKKLNELIQDNDDNIKRAIDNVADKAGDAARTALGETPAAPLAGIGGSLVEQVVKQGLKWIYDLIKDVFGDEFFPIVRIIHTVNYNPPALPYSVFVVMVGKSTDSKMYAITRDQNRLNFNATMNQNSSGYPSYPLLGGRGNRQFQEIGRVMIGYSQTPPEHVPLNLWQQVGEKKAIAEWASSADRQGFHIIASLPQIKGDGLYVWAFRADVIAIDKNEKPLYME